MAPAASPFPPLGVLDICLNVEDFDLSRAFYAGLGFEKVDGEEERGWAIMVRDGVRIGLYKGHVKENVLNFRKGHIAHLAGAMEDREIPLEEEVHLKDDRCGSFTVRDPDGNALFFDTAPSELEDTEPDGQHPGENG